MKDDAKDSGRGGMNRRELLRLLGAGALAALMPVGPAAASAGNFDRTGGPGLVFVVGDGMPAGVVRAMHDLRTGVFGRSDSNYYARMRDPKTILGFMGTSSLSSIVTDSAAASAAWATGVHTVNHSLAVLPDGRKLTTIFELVKPRGVATGLVTTTRITHATPAAWISHQADRDKEDAIALEYLAFMPDVLLGGGRRHFDAKTRGDGRDLLGEFAARGAAVATNRAGLLALRNGDKPLLGVFNGSHISYYLDRVNTPSLAAAQPSLPEMTAAALHRLSRNRGGFLLQVEAGRIDHANHSNDAWAAVMDAIELDETLGVIDAYLRTNPQTLVIVTSDHGNSGWGINGTGPDYNDATRALRSYHAGKASFETLIKRMKGKDAGSIRSLVAEATGFSVSEADAGLLLRAMQPGFELTTGDYVYQPDATLGRLMGYSAYSKQGPATVRRGNVGFTSCTHTAEDIAIMAYGRKAEETGLDRWVDNTDLYGVMCRYFGVGHENPRMTLSEARGRLAERRSADPRLHIA